MKASRNLLYEILAPSYLGNGCSLNWNVKFDMQLATSGANKKKCKIRSKAVVMGSRNLFLEFWDPYIFRERLKLETSNLAYGLATVDPNEKNAK